MEVGADAHQDAARRGRGEEIILKPVSTAFQPLGTLGLGEEIPAVERIHENGERGRLQAKDEMPRHGDSNQRQIQPSRHEKVHKAEADRVAEPPIHHPVEIAVLRVVIVRLVASEPLAAKQHPVDPHQRRRMTLLWVACVTDLLGVIIELGLVFVLIVVGENRARQQPDAFLEI